MDLLPQEWKTKRTFIWEGALITTVLKLVRLNRLIVRAKLIK